MSRAINIFIILMFLALGIAGVRYGLTVGQSNKFSSELSKTTGSVAGFYDGLLLIDFDRPIINSCGDTSIYSFATTPSEVVVQLKPLFIPEEKAEAFNTQSQGNLIVFPIYDVFAFFSVEGVYKIEIYIDNDCTGINSKSIALDPIPLIIKSNTDELT